MVSDSSNSENSPIKNRRRKKPQLLESSASEDEHESPIPKRKSAIRRRVSSSSDSSGSGIVGPSHKKTKVISESESEGSSSTDSEVDQVFRPWISKEKRQKSRTLLRSDSGSSSEDSTNGREQKTRSEDQSTDSDDGDRCIICFKAFCGTVARPSGCSHTFHSECLLTWSKTSNTCPIDRVKYTDVIVTDSRGEVTRHNVITPPPQDHNNDIEPDDTTFCEVCNQHDREHEMLLCDRCEAGYHLDCLNPPLYEVPIGDWFCPDCTSLRNDIDEEEVRDLLRGTMLLENRLRERPAHIRPPRIGPRTRAAQRILSSIREMANQNELYQPSSSTSRSNQRTQRRKRSRRQRRTHYKVELFTAENGTTIEVKVAVNTRGRRKKKRKSNSCRGRSKRNSMKLASKDSGASHENHRSNLSGLAAQPLDIFGSRPQLEYFSGWEAEDELDDESGGGGLGVIRARSSTVRSMVGRKQLAAKVLRTAPRIPRPIPRTGVATAPPDILSSILSEQQKWLSPNAVIHTNSNGDIKIKVNGNQEKTPVKKSVGSEEASSSSSNGQQTSQKEEASTAATSGGQSNGEANRESTSIPPLQPPPQPVFSRAYDDEDFDLYADIEPPVEPPLAPPPEPPPLLLAMEGDDAASSPEDAGLVIDDRQAYDPDVPTTPPPSPPPEEEVAEEKMEVDHSNNVVDSQLSLDLSTVRIPPSPCNDDDIDDCPNRVMYSAASVSIARETKSDSEESDREPEKTQSTSLPSTGNTDIVQDIVSEKQIDENMSDTDVNVTDDSKEEKDHLEEKMLKNEEGSVIENISQNRSEEEEEDDKTEDSTPVETTNEQEAPEKLDHENFEKYDPEEVGKDDTDSSEKGDAISPLKQESKESEKYDPDVSDDDLSEETETKEKSVDKDKAESDTVPFEKLPNLENNLVSESKKEVESESEENDIDLEKVSDEEIGSPQKIIADIESGEETKTENEGTDVKLSSSENGEINDTGKTGAKKEWSNESTPERKVASEKDMDHEGEDVLELGCGDDERDGLVDITDEEISTYEKSWELEDNQAPQDKTVGLEGLDTEAISDCEYNIAEDGQVVPRAAVENGPKEEGEIISEERRVPVAWKKISKSTKERSYREKETSALKEKTKKKEKKPKEKRKELERYDVRKIISDKPKKRRVDEFGRDISPSRSRSLSDSRSRSLSRRRSRSRSKGRRRSRDKRSRNRSRGRSRGRIRSRSRDRSKRRSRGRTKSRSRSDSRRRRSRTPRKNKERRSRAKSREKKRRKRDSSISCSSCSCSSCEQERRKSKKLTVIVPNKPLASGSGKEKKKSKYKDSLKRRRADSPVPSKEVFTSGDNILVSVNFKSSKSGETNRKELSKKKKDEDSKKKKDKSSKENQPLRSIVSKSSSNQQSQKRNRLNARNLKPVAIIDLAQSPFREQTLSPKEIIVLTDSDSDDKRKPDENNLPSCQVTGPKTPPEPHIKFNIISSKPQMLRSLANPLLDSSDQLEGDGDEDDERVEIPHKGPNTPPEPPVPYDPFEPTKSRSPTPLQELEEIRNPTPPVEKNLPIEPIQRPSSPPKPPPEPPKTPSPLLSPPPKPPEEIPEKAALSPPNNCNDDSMDMGGGDSPYSPGSSEAEDLFDAPVTQLNTTTPVAKVKPRQIQQKHLQKLTPSPLKRKPASNKTSTPLKNSKGNNKKETIGLKLDEDQLKILDDLPNSAVEMQVKDKFLKKLNRQERVVEEVKMVLKPHYAKKHVTKEEYKEILRKSVPKICHSRSGEINPIKIQRLIEAYVKKYRHLKKKRKLPAFSAPETLQPLKPKLKPTMWC